MKKLPVITAVVCCAAVPVFFVFFILRQDAAPQIADAPAPRAAPPIAVRPQAYAAVSSEAAPPLQIVKTILQVVPFTSQAPYADWDDERQQDGCEEASALMAVKWARGETLSRAEALREIIAISQYQEERWGEFRDTSARDTMKRIFEGYFNFTAAELVEDIGAEDIKRALAAGNVVVVPADGQKLGNPYFTPPGPPTHMLVIIGYDPRTDEFIVNDPGTKRGAGFRYKARVLDAALWDYPTGFHEEAGAVRRSMIVVRKTV